MNSADIRAALKLRYPQPEAAIVFEVSTSTGAGSGRYVDAVAMDLWPSRGLALTAIEIKVSRSDLLRELKQPEKSEAVAKFCDFFCIAAPKGMVKPGELPIVWGLIEVDEDKTSKTKINPQKTEAQPIGRPFLAAMLRAGSRFESGMIDALMAKRKSEQDKTFQTRLDEAVKWKTRALETEGGRAWGEFLASLDETKRNLLHEPEVIRAVKLVLNSGVAGSYSSIATLEQSLRAKSDELRRALADFDLKPLNYRGESPDDADAAGPA